MELFDKAIKIDPNKREAWYYKGEAFEKLEMYSEAIESFDNIIGINPIDGDAWYYKGEALYKSQRYIRVYRLL